MNNLINIEAPFFKEGASLTLNFKEKICQKKQSLSLSPVVWFLH